MKKIVKKKKKNRVIPLLYWGKGMELMQVIKARELTECVKGINGIVEQN